MEEQQKNAKVIKKECRFCRYIWTPKVKNPKVCPRCRQYRYEKKETQAMIEFIEPEIEKVEYELIIKE